MSTGMQFYWDGFATSPVAVAAFYVRGESKVLTGFTQVDDLILH